MVKFTMKEAYKFKKEALATARQFQKGLKKGMKAVVRKTKRVKGYPYEIKFIKKKR